MGQSSYSISKSLHNSKNALLLIVSITQTSEYVKAIIIEGELHEFTEAWKYIKNEALKVKESSRVVLEGVYVANSATNYIRVRERRTLQLSPRRHI